MHQKKKLTDMYTESFSNTLEIAIQAAMLDPNEDVRAKAIDAISCYNSIRKGYVLGGKIFVNVLSDKKRKWHDERKKTVRLYVCHAPGTYIGEPVKQVYPFDLDMGFPGFL